MRVGWSGQFENGCAFRAYQNAGNPRLLSLLPAQKPGQALDCGCGAGDNARLLRSAGWEVTGVTISESERSSALQYCHHVYIHDLESGIPSDVSGCFDLILFSHVLEHLRCPHALLEAVRPLLTREGIVAVALPNVLHWSNRIDFLRGRFEYRDSGLMDDTHLRFFTFDSGRRLLEDTGYQIVRSTADGSAPLCYLRRLLPGTARRLDDVACAVSPGLFGWQLLYIAQSMQRPLF